MLFSVEKSVGFARKLYVVCCQNVLAPILFFLKAMIVRRRYGCQLCRIRECFGKRKLNVVFVVTDIAKWKGQSLYELMSNSQWFNPVIGVLPTVYERELDEERQVQGVAKKVQYFANRGMQAKSFWNAREYCVADAKEVPMDLLFYQQPWVLPHDLMPYAMSKRALTFYFPYYVLNNLDMDLEIGLELHRLLFVYFVFNSETMLLYNTARNKMTGVHLARLVPTGHPMLDLFERRREVSTSGYVIYAPHWTIQFGRHRPELHYATFLENGKQILEYARKHAEMKWVFKPHPTLRRALVESGAMSKIEVDEYYLAWERIGLACYDADYVDLFNSSRALITDCGSFLTEYACTGMPIVRLVNAELNVEPHPSLTRLYSTYYNVRTLSDMYGIFDLVLVKGQDLRSKERWEALSACGLGAIGANERIMEYLLNLFGARAPIKNGIISENKKKEKRMDINSFTEKVAEQFDDLNGMTVKPESKFRELPSWCSIVALSVIAMVDEEYGVQLTGEDIRNSQSVKDIFDKVVAKRG